ncbi:MAG: ATP-binding protein, partial [Eikenella sp.]|nr:ATP-binding protein [Eikenella sp.]
TNRIEVINRLDDNMQNILTEVQKLALISEASGDAYRKTTNYHQTLGRIQSYQLEVNSLLGVLQSGGQYLPKGSLGGEVSHLNAKVSGGEHEALQSFQTRWKDYQDKIGLLSSYHNILLNRSVAQYVQINHGEIRAHIEDAYLSNVEESNRLARYATILQGATLAAFIIYLLVFVYYFLRRLRKADAQIDLAFREISEIMETVDVGLFLLDRNLSIGDSYSVELENLLARRDLQGQNLMDVLESMVSEEDLQSTQAFIGQLYNPRVKERLIFSLNPLDCVPLQVAGRRGSIETRYLSFRFKRIYHEQEIARVLVNVSDITSAVLLAQRSEQERAQNDMQLEMLGAILSSDSETIKDFIGRARQHAWDINAVLKRQDGSSQHALHEKVNSIFRSVHCLKGEAGALKLHGFIALAENIETQLVRHRSNRSLTGEDFLGLTVSLEEMLHLIQLIESLVERTSNSAELDVAGNSGDSYYSKLVADLAKRNRKQVDFICKGVDNMKNEGLRNIVREISVQLLRNAVVHGIETPEQRTAQRKLAAGHVRMEVVPVNDMLVLSVEDDGKGIDYEAIRRKAVALGIYDAEHAATLGHKQLVRLIFHPGFSTAEETTTDAGCGVGLDIIKDRVISLGGKIHVSSLPNAYTRFSFSFPKNIPWVMKELVTP